MLALGGAGLIGAGACLPDLSPFPPAPDAAEPTPVTLGTCGDGVIDSLDDGGGESCDPGDASVVGCEKCKFTCSGAYDDAGGHCYFWADAATDLNIAKKNCRDENGHLVTFAGAREYAFVSTFAADAGYWLSLYVDPVRSGYVPVDTSEPGWPFAGNACPGCFAVGYDDAGQFELEPGADAAASLPCLAAEDGRWRAVECTGVTNRATLCEREPVGQRIYVCGSLLCTTLAVTTGRKQYVIWPTSLDADAAAATCNSSDGGSLVVFESPEEREQLVREIVQRLKDPDKTLDVWIGLSSTDGVVWRWDVDGGGGLPWANEQPISGVRNRAFLHVDDDKFDTRLAQVDASTSTLQFVCQRPIEK